MATKYRFSRDPESQAPIWISYEVGADGKPQAVLPGAERLSAKQLTLARAGKVVDRLFPAKPQKPCDHGLFSDAADQLDLCEMFQD